MKPAVLAARIKDCAFDYTTRIEVDRQEIVEVLYKDVDLILDFIGDLAIDLGVRRRYAEAYKRGIGDRH